MNQNPNSGGGKAGAYWGVLAALHDGGTMTLAEIHRAMNRPDDDISILPIVGGMVMAGLVDKVVDRPAARPFPWRVGVGVPVRFRITDQGRIHMGVAP